MSELIKKQEIMLERHIREGAKDAAIKLMLVLITAYAKKKNFKKAEKLCDRINEVDSLALSEIIKAHEIIQDEKNDTGTKDYRNVWTNLIKLLSSEETDALFSSMREARFESEDIIIQQGLPNHCLYFVNEGRLKMIHRDDRGEFWIKKLSAGNLFGEDTFFSINVCTTSVIANSKCNISYIDKSILKKWEEEHPFLEANLKKHSSYGLSAYKILERKGFDRRIHKRHRIRHKIHIYVVKSDFKTPLSKPIEAELNNISQGGASIFLSSQNMRTVRALLGRNLVIQWKFDKKTVRVWGTVHGVMNHPFDEYSIHLQFIKSLAVKDMEKLLSTLKTSI